MCIIIIYNNKCRDDYRVLCELYYSFSFLRWILEGSLLLKLFVEMVFISEINLVFTIILLCFKNIIVVALVLLSTELNTPACIMVRVFFFVYL